MVSKSFMIAPVVMGALSTLLLGITLISASNSTDVLKTLNWGLGHVSKYGETTNVYVGMNKWGEYDSGDDDYSYSGLYTDDFCNVSFCDKCSKDNQALLAFVAIFFIASIPALASHIMRWKTMNSAVMRWVGIIFNGIGVLAGAIGMIIFAAGCQKAISDYYDSFNNSYTNSIVWTYGPSFGMLAAATVFKFTESIFCFLVGPDDGSAASGNQM